jgi:hypothetical protein
MAKSFICTSGLRIETGFRKSSWTRKAAIAAAVAGLACAHVSPALAYGPPGLDQQRDGVSAMAYFRVPLGAPTADEDREPSFGLAFRRELQYSDHVYGPGSANYSGWNKVSVDMAELRLNLDGEVQGLEFAGINTLTLDEETRLGALANADNRLLLYGAAAVAAGVLIWVLIDNNDDDD